MRVRQHIHPRCWRQLPLCSRNDVLLPVRGEPAQPVEEDQIAARQRGYYRGLGSAGSGRRKTRDEHVCKAATVNLLLQRPLAVGDDGASDRLEQDAVLVRDLVRRSDKDAAWSIGHVGFDACGNQSHDLFVEHLPVTGVIFVPDHQIHHESF